MCPNWGYQLLDSTCHCRRLRWESAIVEIILPTPGNFNVVRTECLEFRCRGLSGSDQRSLRPSSSRCRAIILLFEALWVKRTKRNGDSCTRWSGAKTINEKRWMDSTLSPGHRNHWHYLNQTKGQETEVDKIHRYFARLGIEFIDDERRLDWMITMSRYMIKCSAIGLQETERDLIVVQYVVKT